MATQLKIQINTDIADVVDRLTTNKVLRVGWVDEKYYEKGLSYAGAAVIHEFGVIKDKKTRIPARPFFRPAIAEDQGKWENTAREGVKALVIKGGGNIEDVMDLIGAQGAGSVKEHIEKVWTPPLAESTVQKRLSKLSKKTRTALIYKPLIDTGNMMGAVIWRVEDE
jgi:hypothetical protein